MSEVLRRFKADIFADYFQFYLWDKVANPSVAVDWTEQDVSNRLKVAPNVAIVSPVRNMPVPVEFEILSEAPAYSLDDWDHVAECSLDLPSGIFEVHECTGGSITTLRVSPGTYRIRAYYGGLNTLSESGLEGEDHYLVTLWRAPLADLNVLKQWHGDVG
jgi:hypothetical protein